MPKDLSDAALVRKVRGDMSQVAFAKELGVAEIHAFRLGAGRC